MGVSRSFHTNIEQHIQNYKLNDFTISTVKAYELRSELVESHCWRVVRVIYDSFPEALWFHRYSTDR